MLRQRRVNSNFPEREQPRTHFENSDCKSKCREGVLGDEITIRFVGDMQQNIEEVVHALRCPEGVREQFRSILRIYASKIDKLREERDFYRQLLCLSEEKQNEEIVRLRQALSLLQQQQEDHRNKNNCQRCTCLDESQFQTSKFSEHPDGSGLSRATLRSFSQHPPEGQSEEEMLIESSKLSQVKMDSLQVSHTIKEQGESEHLNASISEEELNRLMMKYNINTEELEQILEEYDRENRQAYEIFDTERQRQLYRLGQRMQKDLWNKKVIKDIKKISDPSRY